MRDTSLSATPFDLPGVLLITPERFDDERGYFIETFNPDFFGKIGVSDTFVQDAVSRSKRGVIRGLHFQRPPHAQAKLVRCGAGEIFDVVADVDPASPTYGTHVSVTLSGDTQAMLYVPGRYAHGFSVMSEVALVEYKLEPVWPESAAGARYDDPVLAIPWPIERPILSAKDLSWVPLPVR